MSPAPAVRVPVPTSGVHDIRFHEQSDLYAQLRAGIDQCRGTSRRFTLLLFGLAEHSSGIAPETHPDVLTRLIGRLRQGVRQFDRVGRFDDSTCFVILLDIHDAVKLDLVTERLQRLALEVLQGRAIGIPPLRILTQLVYPNDGIEPAEILNRSVWSDDRRAASTHS